MAFKPTTENLWLEVQAAMDETKQHVDVAADIVRRMCGRWYRKDTGEMQPEPENFGYAFMSNTLPALGMANPKVEAEAARVIGHKVVAQAVTDGENAWVEDVSYADITEPVHVDFMVSRGVLMHYLDEDARFSRGSVTPAAKRIEPSRFFQDALADSANTDDFRGHWYWVDIDDLEDDPDVNPEALAQVSPGQDVEPGGGPTADGKQAFQKKSGTALGRRRVKCYSIWMRQTNTIRVLAETSQVVELYPERPYYGPPTGPYVLYDAYPVPGQSWPLPPIVAVQDQAQDLNVHARAMGRAAARRKSIGLVEASNPDLGEKLADAEDGELLPVKGITGNFVQMELGGATQEQYQYTEYARNRLDRISGLTATVQGNVGQADTATEAKIADDALSNRMAYLKNRVMRCTEKSLWIVGWYLFHTEGIVIPVNRRDSYTGEQVEGLFFGGPSPTDAGASWDDFRIRVKVNTMQREAQARDNMIGFYQLFVQIATTAPQMPWVRWMNVLRDLAEAFKVPDKADEWMIPEIFGAFSQPPMFPPSAAMGPAALPPRGAPSSVGGARLGLAQPNQTPGGPGGFAGAQGQPSGTGNITAAGQTSGPVGINPFNRVA